MRVLPFLVFVSILILFFAALRLPKRVYEALATPQPTLGARAV